VVPRLVTYEGATVLGIAVVTSNADEVDPHTGKIPGLWDRFFKEDVLGKIPTRKIPVIPLGVYTNYEGDSTGRYQVIAGTAVDAAAPTPEGMSRATIPAGTYLLFEAEGDMPGVVIETSQAILKYFAEHSGHVRAYATDFEMYRGPRAIGIYISMK
jgi:predicted transcriptional regulator YdeE